MIKNVTQYMRIECMLTRAIVLAAAAHEGQTDKAGMPYISHLSRVASGNLGLKNQIVGWLHDIVEDTPITVEDINALFDQEIADAVDAISRRPGESYLGSYAKRVNQNRIARRVKIVDLFDNLRRDRNPVRNEELEKNRVMYWRMLAALGAGSPHSR
jgi:(p)ppGpp synthase/HD superfamily hydrolase